MCPPVSQMSKEAERSEFQGTIRKIANDLRDSADGWDLKAHARGITGFFEHYFGMA
jgi:hypothetical protein